MEANKTLFTTLDGRLDLAHGLDLPTPILEYFESRLPNTSILPLTTFIRLTVLNPLAGMKSLL